MAQDKLAADALEIKLLKKVYTTQYQEGLINVAEKDCEQMKSDMSCEQVKLMASLQNKMKKRKFGTKIVHLKRIEQFIQDSYLDLEKEKNLHERRAWTVF